MLDLLAREGAMVFLSLAVRFLPGWLAVKRVE
jgi:hypothetical protein